jgi:IclR family transcriptional regulator, pca regulon regulatory protein
VARRTDAPDFVEAIARGFDVIRAFGPERPVLTLSEVAAGSGLARPSARRILLTLEALGYARAGSAGYSLTPRVLELGMAYVQSLGLWEGSGRVFAAMNVTVHAAETSGATLTGDHLPLLLQTAGEVSADVARCQAVPVAQTAG